MTNAEKVKSCLDDLEQRFKIFSNVCPRIWRNVDVLRTLRRPIGEAAKTGKELHFKVGADVLNGPIPGWKIGQDTDWPDWCFLPYQLNRVKPPLENLSKQSEHMYWAQIANLAGWRQTKGIYSFEPYFAEQLFFNTSLKGNIPIDILGRMPAWSTLVTLPDNAFAPLGGAHGALCQLTKVGLHNALAIALLGPNEECGHFVLPIEGTLEQSIDYVKQCIYDGKGIESLEDPPPPFTMKGSDGIAEKLFRTCSDDLSGLLSTLLYLCSERPDVDKIVHKPKPVKTKKGPRIFPAEQPTIINVGVRIGAALRKSLPKVPSESTAEPGHHASPRPHIRSAHWHLFWTGPRTAPIPKVKWLPPIPVNTVYGNPGIVLHPVKADYSTNL